MKGLHLIFRKWFMDSSIRQTGNLRESIYFKLEEHVMYLKRTKVGAAVGTPGRIGKLLCETGSSNFTPRSVLESSDLNVFPRRVVYICPHSHYDWRLLQGCQESNRARYSRDTRRAVQNCTWFRCHPRVVAKKQGSSRFLLSISTHRWRWWLRVVLINGNVWSLTVRNCIIQQCVMSPMVKILWDLFGGSTVRLLTTP